MDAIFLKLVNMSLTAGWLILAVFALRLVLKKAPKWTRCALWCMVGLRLVFPFSIESALSLIPSAETISPDIGYAQTPGITSGIPALNQAVNPIISESLSPTVGASVNPLQVWTTVAGYVWLAGIAAMLLYTAISYFRLRRKVDTAVLLRDNIRQSENVESPFILGLFRPLIYLPFNMTDEDMANVLAHENAHLKRCDHLIKPLAFLLLTVYWFNPLVWLAYILLCRDIELACDERVVKDLGEQERRDYSAALLVCSVSRKSIAACPLAFGEVGVKERIKSVLNYKKPALWIIVVAIVACIVLAVCFLTNPKESGAEKLTLNDVSMLSAKGEALTWSDFDGYSYTETGSGLYIRVYEINYQYSLWIGGGDTDEAPMYIRLTSNTNPDDYIDVRTESVTDFIEAHRLDMLDSAVSAAVLEYNREKYVEGDFACEAHIILDSTSGQDEQGVFITAYTVVRYQVYSDDGETYSEVGGHVVPTTVTFDVTDNGTYTLREYWEPRDGAYYEMDLRENFPAGIVEDAIAGYEYADELGEQCAVQAREYITAQSIAEASNSFAYEAEYVWANYSEDGYNAMVERAENRDTERRYGNVSHLTPVVKLDSKSDYDAFHQEMSAYFDFSQGYDEVPSFDSQAGRYSEDFFAENTLFIAYLEEISTSYRHEVEYARIENGIFEIGIHLIAPTVADTAMAGWFMFVTVPKATITDCTGFDAYICATSDPSSVFPSGKLVRLYSFPGENALQGASISLYDSGEFTFSFSPISSYFGYGTYAIDGDRLTLKTDDGNYTYVFDMSDDTLVFDADASSRRTWYSGMKDGSTFQ